MDNNHDVYFNILKARGLSGIDGNKPLWSLKLSEDEYIRLKATLKEHIYNIEKYGIEAALCYAEWWRRDYNGGIPSKEEVATGLGLLDYYAEDLYKAARAALSSRGFSFIRSSKSTRTEYFRTLLNQGGLPMNYIVRNDSNMGSYQRFLKGLVRELSTINYNWNDIDTSIIPQLNCVSYLAHAFKNENIYDVSMQIAHAIIMEDNNLLPYDADDASLTKLTTSLKNEYSRAKRESRTSPLALHWKLRTTDEGMGYLYVNMDVVKDISSSSIPGLNFSTCYEFDIFIAGKLVGKYVRKGLIQDELGEIISATYTRISVGVNDDILWRGEPVIEVKIRCDNDDRIFLTIAGCYPPNLDYPQTFQMLEDNLYSFGKIAKSEKNIVVYSSVWTSNGSSPINICNQECYCEVFNQSVTVENLITGEELCLTNNYIPYIVEFSGNYIPWVEKSNYKLLSKVPVIRVYDENKTRINDFKVKYRIKSEDTIHWRNLNTSCVLPVGMIEIRVELPNGQNIAESFYSIGDINFTYNSSDLFSVQIECTCSSQIRLETEKLENATIHEMESNKWEIIRDNDSNSCPPICGFRLYTKGNPVLKMYIAIPFNGVMITDVHGNIIPNKQVISLSNLAHYSIISHGSKNRCLNVSYTSEYIDKSTLKKLTSKAIEGLVSLADYSDLITRMFNLYGINSFDRSSSVVLNIAGKEIYIRKFVIDSTIIDGKIVLLEDGIFEDDVYAFPIDTELKSDNSYSAIKLDRDDGSNNIFTFPVDFNQNEVIVFSGPESRYRIIPKYFDLNQIDLSKEELDKRIFLITQLLHQNLINATIESGEWVHVCKAFSLCSRFNLPFATINSLRAIAKDSTLLVKLIIAMWLNEYKEVLLQDIDRFEQEMAIALHWVPAKTWGDCINEYMSSIPEQLRLLMGKKFESLILFLKDLFNATLSTNVIDDYINLICSNPIAPGSAFVSSDIREYKAKIHGLDETNQDLPTDIKYKLHGVYYPYKESMLPYYRIMIESAMCAAENSCNIENRIDLFSEENKRHARIGNFYRRYFKETYSDIFIRTVKYIKTISDTE